MNGTDLLLRDLNIFCTTKTNSRSVMEQLKQLALNNNATGASIYDLGNVIKSESIAELTNVLKASEEKVQKQKQEEQQHQQQMQQEQIKAQQDQLAAANKFKAEEAEKDRRARITEAEIRSAGYGAQSDINQNQQSDYLDAMKHIEGQKNYQETMNLKREQEVSKSMQNSQKLDVERQRLQTQKEIADKQLQVARENKNKYDVTKAPEKKK